MSHIKPLSPDYYSGGDKPFIATLAKITAAKAESQESCGVLDSKRVMWAIA
jgi:hypothetical protein